MAIWNGTKIRCLGVTNPILKRGRHSCARAPAQDRHLRLDEAAGANLDAPGVERVSAAMCKV